MKQISEYVSDIAGELARAGVLARPHLFGLSTGDLAQHYPPLRLTLANALTRAGKAAKANGETDGFTKIAHEIVSDAMTYSGQLTSLQAAMYLCAMCALEIVQLLHGFKEFGGLKGETPLSELTPFEIERNLTSPRKWRLYAEAELRTLGVI